MKQTKHLIFRTKHQKFECSSDLNEQNANGRYEELLQVQCSASINIYIYIK